MSDKTFHDAVHEAFARSAFLRLEDDNTYEIITGVINILCEFGGFRERVCDIYHKGTDEKLGEQFQVFYYFVDDVEEDTMSMIVSVATKIETTIEVEE